MDIVYTLGLIYHKSKNCFFFLPQHLLDGNYIKASSQSMWLMSRFNCCLVIVPGGKILKATAGLNLDREIELDQGKCRLFPLSLLSIFFSLLASAWELSLSYEKSAVALLCHCFHFLFYLFLSSFLLNII